LELREVPGPPLKANEVIRVVCEEHTSTDFDYWVPAWAFTKLCLDLKTQANITLNKQYCTINVLKFKTLLPKAITIILGESAHSLISDSHLAIDSGFEYVAGGFTLSLNDWITSGLCDGMVSMSM
jgi:hypothetical protein